MTEHGHNMLNSATWGGAIMTGVGALSLSEWLAVGGFALALFGAATNFIFKLRADRRARIEHQARLNA